MPNPYFPFWNTSRRKREFSETEFVYGSHDRAFLRVSALQAESWSAPLDNLNDWTCHGHIFHTKDDSDHTSDTDWTRENNQLFAPDVVEKDGKYYLYAYIVNAKGCVAVSDKPEGPFELISKYKYVPPTENDHSYCNDGWFIDPGVLVDDDGRVYIYCGFERSFGAELNAENMYEVIDGTYKADILPTENPHAFFEACSPRKIGDTYYLIYSPKRGSCLAYATSDSPLGEYTYRGYIIDNSDDYPGGNDHGSVCCINDQWYIFYHRMTIGTIMSRRGCAERITILPDGSIPQVEITSLVFENSLSSYKITAAEIACVLKGGCIVAEKNIFKRVVTNITSGCVIGYKYFDFGDDYSTKTMLLSLDVNGMGFVSKLRIKIDSYTDGEEIGSCEIGPDSGVIQTRVKNVTGRHALYFTAEYENDTWTAEMFSNRQLFELVSFVFNK